MNAATRARVLELADTAPETLPASLVELDHENLKKLLLDTQYRDRYETDELTPAQLATKAAALLADSLVDDARDTRDQNVAERAVAEILGR